MFEDKTYEKLLQKKLELVGAGFDKREGSVIYDAMAPNSAEAAQIYANLDWMMAQMFGDTAERDYLVRIAQDTRGIRPKTATCAVWKGQFNTDVETGSRFRIGTQYYQVMDCMDADTHTYRLQCETAGSMGNRLAGKMIPVTYMEGLTSAELTELLIPGEEEEDTESFRRRWRASFQTKAFGGNRADYAEKIKSIDGIGGCKVYRAQNAAGETAGNHVRCVIIASDFRGASDTLTGMVQQEIDPAQDMAGNGLAPIGHIVHIESVKEVPVHISADITYEEGFSFEALQSHMEKAVDAYLLDLAKGWEASGETPLVVRIAKIESAILDLTGVLDIAGTTLNGAEQNLILEQDEIAVRGEIHG